MVTVDEETQAKEFLKRVEIRTMRKDLLALREVDALKERDKIAKLKTLEEQLDEKKKADESVAAKASTDETGIEEVLTKNEGQERIVEKDLKNYATEEERQQIFLFESQRFGFEKQADAIDKEKDPALKLEKNRLLLEKRDQEVKLNSILNQEKKLEDEEKFIAEKEQTTAIASQRKGLEQSRWDLDKKIQDIEKKRWEVEKQIENINHQISQIDENSEQLVSEKNSLHDKILGIDKSLREIYSGVMAREEERRRGEAQEQIASRGALSKARLEEKEKVQRQQWTHSKPLTQSNLEIPVPIKRGLEKRFNIAAEEEQRKKFLQDIEESQNSK